MLSFTLYIFPFFLYVLIISLSEYSRPSMSITNKEYTLSNDALLIEHSNVWTSVDVALQSPNLNMRELAQAAHVGVGIHEVIADAEEKAKDNKDKDKKAKDEKDLVERVENSVRGRIEKKAFKEKGDMFEKVFREEMERRGLQGKGDGDRVLSER